MKNEQQPKPDSKTEVRAGVRVSLKKMFEEGKSTQEIIDHILEGLQGYFKIEGVDEDSIRAQCAQCLQIEDSEEVVERLLEIFEPLIEFKFANPKQYEKLQRQAFGERQGFIPLNEALFYGFDEDSGVVHIHLAPSREHGFKDGLKGGLMQLARIMEANPKMTEVSGTSWILERRGGRRIIERLGFHYDGPIDDEMRQAHFADEERPVGKAHMDRDEFLVKYLE